MSTKNSEYWSMSSALRAMTTRYGAYLLDVMNVLWPSR
jgi:hypothetical protein